MGRIQSNLRLLYILSLITLARKEKRISNPQRIAACRKGIASAKSEASLVKGARLDLQLRAKVHIFMNFLHIFTHTYQYKCIFPFHSISPVRPLTLIIRFWTCCVMDVRATKLASVI